MLNEVPPTDSTLGEMAGHVACAPLSPADAMNVTPLWPAGVVKYWSYCVSLINSLLPQLMDTTDTPAALRA